MGRIKDNMGQEVINLQRPLRCSSCFFFCCLQSMEVTSPITGQTLGFIKQKWHPFLPIYAIEDENGTEIFEIKGPLCTFSCFCGDVEFPICSKDGQEVGKISKQWSGLLKEHFTDADNFGCTFPLDLDVKIKAVLLAAVFLIDFMFFEESGDDAGDAADAACGVMECICCLLGLKVVK